jgi:hypothetical protein
MAEPTNSTPLDLRVTNPEAALLVPVDMPNWALINAIAAGNPKVKAPTRAAPFLVTLAVVGRH